MLIERSSGKMLSRTLGSQAGYRADVRRASSRRSVRFSIVGALPQLPHITGFSVRLGGICPAARCRGTLVPWRM